MGGVPSIPTNDPIELKGSVKNQGVVTYSYSGEKQYIPNVLSTMQEYGNTQSQAVTFITDPLPYDSLDFIQITIIGTSVQDTGKIHVDFKKGTTHSVFHTFDSELKEEPFNKGATSDEDISATFKTMQTQANPSPSPMTGIKDGFIRVVIDEPIPSSVIIKAVLIDVFTKDEYAKIQYETEPPPTTQAPTTRAPTTQVPTTQVPMNTIFPIISSGNTGATLSPDGSEGFFSGNMLYIIIAIVLLLILVMGGGYMLMRRNTEEKI